MITQCMNSDLLFILFVVGYCNTLKIDHGIRVLTVNFKGVRG